MENLIFLSENPAVLSWKPWFTLSPIDHIDVEISQVKEPWVQLAILNLKLHRHTLYQAYFSGSWTSKSAINEAKLLYCIIPISSISF